MTQQGLSAQAVQISTGHNRLAPGFPMPEHASRHGIHSFLTLAITEYQIRSPRVREPGGSPVKMRVHEGEIKKKEGGWVPAAVEFRRDDAAGKLWSHLRP